MDRSEYRGRRVVIVGPDGKTGISAARLLQRLGCRLLLADSKPESALASLRDDLAGVDYTLHAGGTPPELAREADLILLSPGVPRTIPLVAEAKRLGVEVIGDVELAWRLMGNRFAGITGTDGKSTTTSMMGSILAAAKAGRVAGNIGIPVLSLVDGAGEDEILCLELSSFQLESCPTFSPEAAMILNIRPDHLDRYPDMDAYLDAKLNLFRNMKPGAYAVLPADDARYEAMAAAVPDGVPIVRFSMEREEAEFHVRDGVIRTAGRDIFDLSRLPVSGSHNERNALAAAALSASLHISDADIAAGLAGYAGLPHRYESAGTAGGVSFINDSKATTISAVAAAAASTPEGGAILLGGKNKGLDFSSLRPLLEERRLSIYYFGEAGPEVRSMIGLEGKTIPDLEEAVRTAYTDQKGTTSSRVLLSPGGTSYDAFPNFEKRGEFFKALVAAFREEDGP